jgi:L-ascorbate metabolism protein UlaG (beta-lactamase superfamily)
MLRAFLTAIACLVGASIGANGQDKKSDDKPAQDAKAQEKQPPNKLAVSWHGQSFFTLHTKAGTVVAFDPHAIPEYGRLEGINPNLILLSHNHNDHTQIGIFDNLKEKGDKAPKIIAGLSLGENGRETWNIFDEKFKDLRVYSVGAYHDEFKGMKHGLTALFVVEVDGWRICHLGDLGHDLSAKQLKALGPIDVLMIPCGGIYGLNGSEARRVLDQIKPKQYVLPMHIGNSRYSDLLPVDEFIDESPYPCAIVRDGTLHFSKNSRNNVAWLRENTRNSDNTLVLERHQQKRAIVVNLHYWPQVQEKKKKAS